MIHYFGEEFEQKLQWEEKEYHYQFTSAEQQFDNLVAGLEDRNAELRSLLTTEQNSPPQGGALPAGECSWSQ